MRHIKALSKFNPKAAASIPTIDKSCKPCDTILKTSSEKDAKKNDA